MAIESWDDNVAVAHLSDHPQLSEDLDAVLIESASGEKHLVADLSGVQFLNSSDIARLLKLRRGQTEQDRRLLLCGIQPPVWETFRVTGLDKVFVTADSVPMALALLQVAE